MRILHIIIDLTPGGAELMLKRLIASHREDLKYRHIVLSLRSLGSVGPELQAMGVEVQVLGLDGPVRLVTAMPRLVRRIRRIDPDIVQNWMYHADFLGGLAARAAGKRHVLWNVRIAEIGPEMGVSRATSLIRRACAAVSRHVPERIVYVAHSARRVHERLGYDPSKSVVIPNGYELPRKPAHGRLRGELGLDPDIPLIGSAGRFNAQKDHRGFITAAGEVARTSNAHFVMMGRGLTWDNEELTTWVNGTGFAHRFHLLGQRDDIADCLPDLDIFCLHSIGEGFPNVVAEAMSVALPCVVTDVGDAALLVDDTGFVVPPSDPPALAAALSRMIAIDAEERRRLGARARRRIEENFSMEAIRARYEQLYQGLLQGEQPSVH